MSNQRSAEQAGQVYDVVSPMVDAFGDGQFHLSYWYGPADDTPFVAAAERVSRKVSDALGLRPGDHLLDAGCGPGATAVLIGTETGARITGISVSQYDVDESTRRAKAAGLADRLRFEQGDYMALAFPDGTFDAVMAIESLLCAPDLGHVLRELHRVLRPGGAVALSHCTLEKPMPAELGRGFAESIMATTLPTLQEWVGALREAGFDIEEYTQFGPRVLGMPEKFFQAVADTRDTMVATAGEGAVTAFEEGLRKFFAPGPEYVGYAIIAGRKRLDAA
jgi:cyclopropane fatty-acyl-phospholipid synthase-like methyltransferase